MVLWLWTLVLWPWTLALWLWKPWMLLLMNDANMLQMIFYSIYKHCAIVLVIIDSIYKHCGNLSTSTCGIVLVIIDSIYKHCAIVWLYLFMAMAMCCCVRTGVVAQPGSAPNTTPNWQLVVVGLPSRLPGATETTWERPGRVGSLHQTGMGGPLPWQWPGRWAGLATTTLPNTP